MIPITQDFIHINPFSRDGAKLKGKKGIVMHYTASPGAPAMNINHYFDSLKDQIINDNIVDRYAGAHFSVDRCDIIQSIPTDERGYHCGSSQPYLHDALALLGTYPNDTTVGIEMCIELDGSIHEDTFQNAAELVVWLIREDGFPNTIFTHKSVVGWKNCPLPWVQNPSEFDRFKVLVNIKLEELRMIDELNARIAVLENAATPIPAPKWLTDEFPNVDLNKIINSPLKTEELWEVLAITWRSIGFKG